MACAQCVADKLKDPPGCATCRHCGEDICLPRCPRPDGHWHGDRCECCGDSWCRADLEDHRQAMHPGYLTSGRCFPDTAGTLGARTLTLAVRWVDTGELGEILPEGAADVFNDFLNVVAPGRTALLRVLDSLVDAPVARDPQTWGAFRAEYVRFEPRFFDLATMERIALLAVQALGEAGPALLAKRGMLRRARAMSLPGFENAELLSLLQLHDWTRTRTDPPSWSLSSWMPRDHSPGTRTWLLRLFTLRVPESAGEIASWLTESWMGVPA